MKHIRTRIEALRGHGQDGFATAFTVVLAITLLVCAGLLLDGGLALSGKVTALDEAQEAARTGAQAINLVTFRATGQTVLDPQAAATAAKDYLAGTGDTGTVQVSGNTVAVTVTHTQRTQLLNLADIKTITVHASAHATAEQTS
ncbi:hypothetical protein [Actinospica robiniae]|uniref:hypothetical protein n=1 Tax=Actinospica robiniae TaxID=304901 RepID=UPI000407C417|nr:hypothetical protein [Actinospica robiniae]